MYFMEKLLINKGLFFNASRYICNMKLLHLDNFRKSVCTSVNMSSFTLLIGKNNSGKSNVAKALLLVSDYLESDSISEFPLNGTNSVYHKIEKYNELQTFLTDQNAAMSSYLNKENQPKITLKLTGGASFSILLKKGVENVEILVENVQLTDSNNNVIFKINILDIDIIEVFYSMKGIQDFLFNYKIQTNEVFGKKTDEEDLRQILNSQLQKKNKRAISITKCYG